MPAIEFHENNIGEDVLEVLVRNIPGLGSAITSDHLLAVRLLRQWVAQFGNGSDWTTDRCSGDVARRRLSLDGHIYFAQEKKSGLCCAGFADFFAKLCSAFGYPSAELGVGLWNSGGGLSHALTLVEIPGAAGPVVYACDPYLNFEYGIEGHAHSPFLQVVRALLSGQTGPTKVDGFQKTVRDIIHHVENKSTLVAGSAMDADSWFFSSDKSQDRAHLAAIVDISVEDLSTFHILLSPLYVHPIQRSKGLQSAISDYAAMLRERGLRAFEPWS